MKKVTLRILKNKFIDFKINLRKKILTFKKISY